MNETRIHIAFFNIVGALGLRDVCQAKSIGKRFSLGTSCGMLEGSLIHARDARERSLETYRRKVQTWTGCSHYESAQGKGGSTIT